ncbi:hypothetical protein [Methanoculleus sp. 7T]|jgi:hypothetical protein|uniref:hypothetical protein n=1 Tax=Methanoculleus sp. 7T TaxID=2937282 RepID=UPI0020BEE3D2|nr:hypothetical protein [Methanoculleus sp. 7T]MCK8518791.1 hypothetical protein [Methanoculleus sp. 7T]
MTDKRTAPRYLLIFLFILTLALVAPAAAQDAGPKAVQPGETVFVGSEPLVLDIINLRNPDTFNPVTELRRYREDNPAKQIIRVIGVPNDGYFKISDQALGGKYGRYYAYSKKDGLVEGRTIIFAPAATTTAPPTETTAATEIPTEAETPPTEAGATPTRTQAPLPGLIAVAAVGICGLLTATGRR